MADTVFQKPEGRLYVVATPIGNLADITLRAIDVLSRVDYIAAEDTRRTRKLLSAHGISGRLISYGEHNEPSRTPDLLRRLEDGHSIALVSDAGTPSLSDPGYRLVCSAIEKRIEVTPVPGVSAAIAALSASGLPTDAFVFIGFPQKKGEKRRRQLKALASEARTLLFFESPKRILGLIDDIIDLFGSRHGVLAREMTKIHEEFLRGDLAGIRSALSERPSIKGECTLLVAGRKKDGKPSMQVVKQDIEKHMATDGLRLSEAVRQVAATHGLPKRQIYQEALKGRKGRKP